MFLMLVTVSGMTVTKSERVFKVQEPNSVSEITDLFFNPFFSYFSDFSTVFFSLLFLATHEAS